MSKLILVIVSSIRRGGGGVQAPRVIKELSSFIETKVKASHRHIYKPADSMRFLGSSIIYIFK
jgi:hypothetical protein